MGYSVPATPDLDPMEVSTDGQPVFGRLFDFAGWLYFQSPSISPSTVSSYVSTVRQQLACIFGWTFAISTLYTKSQYRRTQARGKSRFVDPATRALLMKVMQDTSAPIGLRAAVLIAWHGLLRVSEYTVSSGWEARPDASMLCRDFAWYTTGDFVGFRLRLRHSKSDPFNTGGLHYYRRGDVGDPLCPYTAMQAYLPQHPARQQPMAPLFMLVVGGRVRPVSRNDIAGLLKKWAPAVGLMPEYVSTHSLRVGGAFQMADANVALDLIRQRGRWGSQQWESIVLMYTRMSTARLHLISDAMASAPSSALLGRH